VAAILNALEETAERIRLELDGLHAIREKAFKLSREIVMSSSTAIKHMHRHDVEEARRQLAETAGLVTEMQEALAEAPWLGGGGFVGDSEKEYVEAAGVIACLSGEVVPTEVELGVSGAVWLNGLSEVVGELRRHVLDLIREGQPERAEASLSAMEDIYHMIMSFDYPDAITLGLRRRSDAARGMIERTRGDLTNALRQASLEKRLAELEERL
jgi:translin